MTDAAIRFDAQGLVPCVVQDARTGEVLTLAYMNEDSLARTRETGETWFWSRSRAELWHKGATSGNVQKVRALRFDCDLDAVLALVETAGPACHTGARTCFHNAEQAAEPVEAEALAALERTVVERRTAAPTAPGERSGESAAGGSYTARLLADPPLIGEKVREEADEVARAAAGEPDERVAEEAADVLYHLTVLLASRGLTLADAQRVLNDRRR